MLWGVEDEDEIRLRLCRSGFSVVLISLPMNCQSGSREHGAKKFGDVFVGSFVGSFVDASHSPTRPTIGV
jgi:hypothetical protein